MNKQDQLKCVFKKEYTGVKTVSFRLGELNLCRQF